MRMAVARKPKTTKPSAANPRTVAKRTAPPITEAMLAYMATRRRPTNVSVRGDLIVRAKMLRINMSRVLEAALIVAIREHEQQAWLAENEASIDAYNAAVANHGLFSDDWRRF